MVLTVYEYPSFATSKSACVFFVLLAGIFWFLPTALISAEMASVEGWSEGGVFGWVGNALHSERLGFLAVFFQWFQVTVCFVTMCYFIIGVVAYAFQVPVLSQNPFFKFVLVLALFGGISLLELGGTKRTALIAKYGFTIGVLGSTAILFVLAIVYWAQGNPVQIHFGVHDFFPDFTKAGFLGHLRDVHPRVRRRRSVRLAHQRAAGARAQLPAGDGYLVAIAIVLDALGGIAVAAVVSQKELFLNAGIFQTLQLLMYHFSPALTWLLGITSLLIVFGVVAEIGSGNAGIVSFLVATTLTTLIYLVCYFLMYASYFRLIFTGKDLHRTYNVPGGIVGKTIAAVCGTITSIIAFVMSFTPSSALPSDETGMYLVLLAVCFVVSLIIPIVISAFHKDYVKGLDPSRIKQLQYEKDAVED